MTIEEGSTPYTIEEDSNGNLVYKHPTNGTVATYDEANDMWELGSLDTDTSLTDPAGRTYNSYLSALVALSEGQVVAVGDDGTVTFTDPANTNTPVQDAYADLNTASGHKGVVYLPPQKVRDIGPVEVSTPNTAIKGLNYRSSILEVTGDGNNVIEISASQDIELANFDVQHANGDTGNTGRGIQIVSSLRNLSITNLGFRNLAAAAIGTGPGGQLFQSDIDKIDSDNIDPAASSDAFLDFTGGSGLGPGNSAGVIGAYPSGASGSDTDIVVVDGGFIDIETLNIGGAPDKAVKENTGHVSVDRINYEPTSKNSSTNAVVILSGNQASDIGMLQVRSSSQTIDYAYMLRNDPIGGEGPGNKVMGVVEGESNLGTNTVDINNQPSLESWYFGTASDIDNNAGSSTGSVRSLATAGTGNG